MLPFTAKATDNQGIVTTSSTIGISVMANNAPTISLTSPTPGSTLKAPASFTLAANAADPDGNLATVAFYQNGSLIATLTVAPYSVAWSNVYPSRIVKNSLADFFNRSWEWTYRPM